MFSRARVLTLLLALIGALLFTQIGIPLPFLFGPMAACLIAALCGMKLKGAGVVSVGARTILGISVGTTLTPAVIATLPQMVGSLLLIPLYVALIGVIGIWFFHKVCGFDRITSYYAAMPGGFQDMVVFGEEAGADVRALSLIHATRVLIIIVLVPLIMVHLYGKSLDRPVGPPLSDTPWVQLALMLAAAVIGWKGGERIGLFGATIIGPMVLSGALTMAGVLDVRPPKEAVLFAQFFIGTGIGVYYVGVTLAELRRDVAAGVVFALILGALTLSFTLLVGLISSENQLEIFLAFAPGGQAELTLLALIAGADLGFVVAHHLTRLVLVISCAPIAVRLWHKKEDGG